MTRLPVPPWLATVLAVLALFGVGGLTLAVSDGDLDGKPDSVTIRVDGADKDRKADDKIKVPVAAVEEVQATQAGGHEDLRTEAPPGVTQEQLDASQDKQEELVQNDQLPLVQPDAAPSQRGCTSRFVKNVSSRRGVKPREWVAHYTVSPNRPGWSDVWAVVNLFNSASSQASSNYVIDAEGHCAYIVRESDKAWTQAGGNPYSISVEIINSGRETSLAGTAGLRKVGQVISDSAKRWDIPLARGRVSGCLPLTPGIIQHKDWGLCGGGHVDITPFSVDPVIKAAIAARGGSAGQTAVSKNDPKRYRLSVLTKGERAAATCLLLERRVAARHHGWGKVGASHRVRAQGCKNELRLRNEQLHGLGLTRKAERRARHGVIHAVV